MHITLGIFLKIFKLFDRAAKHLDYRLSRCGELEEGEGDELEEALQKVTDKEDSIERHRENLEVCTEMYYKQLMDIEDEDEARDLTTTFLKHCESVGTYLKKMVCYC